MGRCRLSHSSSNNGVGSKIVESMWSGTADGKNSFRWVEDLNNKSVETEETLCGMVGLRC